MAVRVGINGFGRIGRQVLKAIFNLQTDAVAVVAVNDLTDDEALAHLFRYDSNYGRHEGTVEVGESGTVKADGRDVEWGTIIIDGREIKSFAEPDPSALPWKALGVEIVLESTGVFREREAMSAHLRAGAKKVVLSAPGSSAEDVDCTLVLGVNDDVYDPSKHSLVSNASCTTNCLGPVAKVLHDNFGIECGLMTTIHAYTSGQKILDLPHKDYRRMRAAALSLIPTTTGAARAIGLVIPELDGKLDGFAIRVPTPTVSVVDLTCTLGKSTTADEINAAMQAASEGALKGILGYEEQPLVSVDYKGDPRSGILDAESTSVIPADGGNLAKVVAWYDNEWGYSCRVADLLAFMAEKGI